MCNIIVLIKTHCKRIKTAIPINKKISYALSQFMSATYLPREHIMKHLRFALLLITAALCGCVYHQPIQQGNIFTATKMETIHNGMSSADVIAKLGSPVLENMYADNRMTRPTGRTSSS